MSQRISNHDLRIAHLTLEWSEKFIINFMEIGHQPFNRQRNIQNITSILEEIKKSEWRKVVTKALKDYNLKIYNLNKLTPHRVKQLHLTIINKFYKNDNIKECWSENQLRIFIWTVFTYGGAINKHPQFYNLDDWEIISNCFLNKTPFFCQFQFKCLKKVSENTDKWTKQQEDLMQKIIIQNKGQDPQKIKWNDIAKKIYLTSDKNYFRTAKQCRQHWNTYLDPNKLKCAWSFNEDLLLVKNILCFGRKWSKIAQLLENKRSQHNVKNRFNSLISKYRKVHRLKQNDYIQAENIYQWLNDLSKNQNVQLLTKVEQSSKTSSSQEVKNYSGEEIYGRSVPKIEPQSGFKQLRVLPTQHFVEKSQSPQMFISPMQLNFQPIMFSGMNYYYRSEPEGMINFFSFQNLLR